MDKKIILNLCPEGQRYHDDLMGLLGIGTHPDNIYKALQKYFVHRRQCTECFATTAPVHRSVQIIQFQVAINREL